MESISEFATSLIREIPVSFVLEFASEFAASMVREILEASSADSSTEFNVTATVTHMDRVFYNGDIAPGDRLIIDMARKTITLNGVNVLDKMNGEFFALIFGDNAIKYEDNEVARTLLTRITHRDKYLY